MTLHNRTLIAALAAGALLVGLTPAVASAAATRVDLRLLVVTDGGPNVTALTAQMDREGVPYDLIDLTSSGRPTVTAAYLADSVNGVPRARYQGLVLPNESALPAAELAELAAYQTQHAIRQVDAYTWAHPEVGLGWATYIGALDGMTTTVTAAGQADGFGYLAGPVRIDDLDPSVLESYGYLAVPAELPAGATFTPLLTVPNPTDGSTATPLGVYAHDGREELVGTIAYNQAQTHAKILAHGVIEWVTRGVHLGQWRNWFAVHLDDVFLPDDRWHTEANCTVGDDCNPNRDPALTPYNQVIRMVPADVDRLLAWQQENGLKLDLAFNGGGSQDAGADDPLTAALVASGTQFRWLNHTYQHPYLGCVQDFSVSPWRCKTTLQLFVAYVSRAQIRDQIRQNTQWAGGHGIALNARELVTGEHSGLRSLPQMPADNPNLAPALADTNVRFLASDASRESNQRSVGSAATVPRYPMNIFYNVATVAEEIDEYNWIYTSRADGGSGICEADPATSTCIAPLSVGQFTSHLVPLEARIAFGHVVGVDPRPHYAHQSNITEERVLYPVLDAVLAQYRACFATNTPLLNPRMSESSDALRRTDAWRTAVAARTVEAYVLNGQVTVVNHGSSTVDVPLTVPETAKTSNGGAYGELYGARRSAWQSLGHNAQLVVKPAG